MIPSNTALVPTADEYWRIFALVRNDVGAAISSNETYLEIHNLAASERPIYDRLQKFGGFWSLNSSALQTTFFIAFGRIFDNRRDSLSIQALVNLTVANPALFSKKELRKRKRESLRIFGATPDPEWLAEYIQNAWEPTAADLEPLRVALVPHRNRFNAIYRPIRHKVFAHRSLEDEQAITALFSRTHIGEVAEILRFLHTLLWAITEMAWNAKRPDLTDFSNYESYVSDIRTETTKFVQQLS